jgi:hypothetical protein
MPQNAKRKNISINIFSGPVSSTVYSAYCTWIHTKKYDRQRFNGLAYKSRMGMERFVRTGLL